MNTPSSRSGRSAPTVAFQRRRILLRLAFILPFAVALGLIAWSLQRLRPILRETAAMTARVNRLNGQIDDCERGLQKAEQSQLNRRFDQALSGYLGGEEALRVWLSDAREKAAPLALVLTSEIGEPVAQDIGGQKLMLIPVHLEIRPSEDVSSPRSPYQRLIEFCQFVATHPQRADVEELRVLGQSGSVSRAVLQLQLWARSPQS